MSAKQKRRGNVKLTTFDKSMLKQNTFSTCNFALSAQARLTLRCILVTLFFGTLCGGLHVYLPLHQSAPVKNDCHKMTLMIQPLHD